MQLFIDCDGKITGIESDITARLHVPRKGRVSHIEPVNRVLRKLFHVIRRRVSDTGYIAAFTRMWPCRWQAHIFNGPTLGPFSSRRSAVEAEVQYINSELEKERNLNGRPMYIHRDSRSD